MNKVKLFTASGAFVTDVGVPVFDPKPTVILWGLRVFAFSPGDKEYREVFYYAVPPEMKGAT